MNNKIKDILAKYGIYAVLVLMFIFFSVVSDSFLKPENLLNIMRQVAVVGIATVGMTFVMITGGIDLSVGSIIGVTGIVAAILMSWGIGMIPAILIALVVGIILGLLNAFIINELKIPPLIVTLGTMTSLRGLTYLVTNGMPVFGFPPSFAVFGQGNLFGIPIPVIIMAVCFICGFLILERHTIGRYVYGIGGNEEASRLSGVNVKKIKYFVYAFSGFLSAIAGIVLLSRTNSGQPKAGTSYEMDIITAVVLGGISITGGEGKITGVVAGVFIMGILTNGMIITGVGDYVQRIVQGLVLIAAVAFDCYNHHKK